MKKRLPPFVLFSLLFTCFTLKAQWTSMGSGISVPQRVLGGIAPLNKNVIWGFTWHASQFVPTREFTRTTDGGQSWHAGVLNGVDPDQFAFCLFPLDSQTAWLATADEKNPIKGKIYKTTDGGASWVHQATGFTGFNETPAGVYFWNENEGVAYGATGETTYNDQIAVYTTADGGANWTKVVAPDMPAQLPGEGMSLYNLAGFFSVAGDTFWFGTTQKRVFRSADRGKTWQVFDTPLTSSNYISSIGFRDGQTGLALGYNPFGIARSTDGGATWAKLPLSVPSNFRGMQIEYVPGTRSTWYLMTSPTKYMVSYNDGDTWETFDSNIEPWSLEFLDAKTGFAGSYITSPTQGGAYRWTGAPLGNRWFVNDDAAGADNGNSWADAFTDLQSALAAATEGDQIWVAEGLYKPAAPNGSPAATFLIDKNIRLYGGFAGTETMLAQRGNPADHPAVLSGDLNGDDVADDFTANRNDNVMTVVTVDAGITRETVIDGFTISNGQADGSGANTSPNRNGGGLYAAGAPLLTACVFEQNYAGFYGGGAYFNYTGTQELVISACSFSKNKAVRGGGLNIENSHCRVSDCTFRSNLANEHGGGMRYTSPTGGRSVVVVDCHFENNQSSFGGGLRLQTLSDDNNLLISDCDFTGNAATILQPGFGQGGGGCNIALFPNFKNNRVSLKNNRYHNNTSSGDAAGCMMINAGNNGTIEVDSCLFGQNRALYNGSGFWIACTGKGLDFKMRSCQFIENIAENASAAADFWGHSGGAGTILVDSCRFEGNISLWSGAVEMGNGNGGSGTQVNYRLTNSVFKNNRATEGGAVGLWCDAVSKADFILDHCIIDSNVATIVGGGLAINPSSKDFKAKVSGTKIIHNQSLGNGGAFSIYHFFSNLPFPTSASCSFENCLIAENASNMATIASDSMANLQFLNSTIANNTGNGIQLSDHSGLTLQNTILYNPGFAEYTALTNDVTIASLGGNLIGDSSLFSHALSYDLQNADPLFAGPGDYRLSDNSPAIDKGVDRGNLPTLDLAGNDRLNGCVDIGAYESAVTVSTACVTGSHAAPAVGLLSVSPNPVADFLSLQLPENGALLSNVQVFDGQGRLVMQHAFATAGEALQVADLMPGLYVMKATAGGRAYAGRFVKL